MVRVDADDATSEADRAQEESGGAWRLLWTDHDTITQ